LAATTEEALPEPPVDAESPPYSVTLPVGAVGHTLQVAIHGTATGRYSVRYGAGSADFSVSPPLTGMITQGQVIQGHVTVTSGACYANCDGSSNAPVLNINDFVCFQQRFAGGDTYANCDNSTSLPVLNINDFVCFQQKFAAGCP